MMGGMGMSMGPQPINQWAYADAVCCMPGMSCWNSSYENMSGRESMVQELEHLRSQFPDVKAHFDELNKENVAKARALKQQQFAESKQLSKELTNKVKDANLRKTKLEGSLANL